VPSLTEVPPGELQEYRLLVAAHELLTRRGTPAEYWQLFILLRTDRLLLHNEVRYLLKREANETRGTPTALLRERLREIELQFSSRANEIRRATKEGMDGEFLPGLTGELAIGLYLAEEMHRTPQGPPGEGRLPLPAEIVSGLRKAQRVVHGRLSLLCLADPRGAGTAKDRGALRRIPAGPDGPFAGSTRPLPGSLPAGAIKAPLPSSARASEPLPDVEPEVLEDLRRIERLRSLFRRIHHDAIDPWEGLALIALDPPRFRPLVDHVTGGKPLDAVPPAEVRELFDRLDRLGDTHLPFVQALRSYLRTLPLDEEGDLFEVALAFLVASPRGCETAHSWLAEPVRLASEATLRMDLLLRKARAYDAALRQARPHA
jgi:hypothetical protein